MGNEVKEIFNYCYEDKYYIEEVAERKLFLNNEVEEYVVGDLVRHIFRYNRLDKGIPVEERKLLPYRCDCCVQNSGLHGQHWHGIQHGVPDFHCGTQENRNAKFNIPLPRRKCFCVGFHKQAERPR